MTTPSFSVLNLLLSRVYRHIFLSGNDGGHSLAELLDLDGERCILFGSANLNLLSRCAFRTLSSVDRDLWRFSQLGLRCMSVFL